MTTTDVHSILTKFNLKDYWVEQIVLHEDFKGTKMCVCVCVCVYVRVIYSALIIALLGVKQEVSAATAWKIQLN